MTAAYLTVAGWWGYLCYKHKEDILPMQVRLDKYPVCSNACLTPSVVLYIRIDRICSDGDAC